MKRKILVTIEAKEIFDDDIGRFVSGIEDSLPGSIAGGDGNYNYVIEEVEE